jgi:inner membrane protein
MELKELSEKRWLKVLLLGILLLVFLIPAGMIKGLVYERMYRAEEAEQEIMKSWGDEFVLSGPVLRIPGKERNEVKSRNAKGELVIDTVEHDFYLWVAPAELKGDIALGTEVKKRGIFSVPLFAGTVHLQGNFDTKRALDDLKKNQQVFPASAEMVITLANQRGIRGIEAALWNSGTLEFLPGSLGFEDQSYGSKGIHSPAALIDGSNHFDITMDIQGGKSLRMVPLGEDSEFTLKADWPSPSFQGSYLPVESNLDEKGFDAVWKVSHLSRSIPLSWMQNESESAEKGFEISSSKFGVNFFKALDHYNMNLRTIKYMLLFIIIPFLGFFLFEIFLHKNIHPVQYLLSGAGNVIFYLLLLSFSEHTTFYVSYLIAAPAVIIMMICYSRSLLGAWSKSWIMGFIMLICYSFLYFTLQSEDWALLIGSIGAFAITALVMFLTRSVNWSGKRSDVKSEQSMQSTQSAQPDQAFDCE